MATLKAFSAEESSRAKALLATSVAKMMGRKFEEGDWSSVYCGAKQIPEQRWSNLHIDVMFEGLGVEHKMLCIGEGKSLLSLAGTTLMHPSATRSIRVESTSLSAQDAMVSILNQYKQLIEERTMRVTASAAGMPADMRTGWLLWERSLTEFLYFEERMTAPNPDLYWAEWNERSAKGSRKGSKNLWIYEGGTNKKRFSVTTMAGAKIQPYFDVPAPKDPNLYLFRVQSEPIEGNLVRIWVTSATAGRLKSVLNDPGLGSLSKKIVETSSLRPSSIHVGDDFPDLAVPVDITLEAHDVLTSRWVGVSDEHRIQLLLQSLTA